MNTAERLARLIAKELGVECEYIQYKGLCFKVKEDADAIYHLMATEYGAIGYKPKEVKLSLHDLGYPYDIKFGDVKSMNAYHLETFVRYALVF